MFSSCFTHLQFQFVSSARLERRDQSSTILRSAYAGSDDFE